MIAPAAWLRGGTERMAGPALGQAAARPDGHPPLPWRALDARNRRPRPDHGAAGLHPGL